MLLGVEWSDSLGGRRDGIEVNLLDREGRAVMSQSLGDVVEGPGGEEGSDTRCGLLARGITGLSGWQWIFIIEGILHCPRWLAKDPSPPLAVFVCRYNLLTHGWCGVGNWHFPRSSGRTTTHPAEETAPNVPDDASLEEREAVRPASGSREGTGRRGGAVYPGTSST